MGQEPRRLGVESVTPPFNDLAGFAEALDMLLTASPHSLRRLAREIGVTASTISSWRNARHLPYPRQHDVLVDLLRRLEVDDPKPWLDGLILARAHAKDPVGPNPFQGLVPYTPEKAVLFFGRDEFVGQLKVRVTAALGQDDNADIAYEPILVVGASGSGKTSALRAGLEPALLNEGHDLRYVGADPDDPEALVAEADSAGGGQVIVVVDQFETVLSAKPDVAERYVQQLAELLRRGHVVIVSLRADHYHLGLEHDLLTSGLRRPVVPDVMTEDRVADCIELPAQLANMAVETQLTRQLLADFGEQARSGTVGEVLPLLSHVLYEIAGADGAPVRGLTLARYEDVGGLAGALRQTAEKAFASLDRIEQDVCRTLLTTLVEVGRDDLPVRRPARLEVLRASTEYAANTDAYERVLNAFVAERLLTVERNTVTISHEALLRAWGELADWIDEQRTSLTVMRRIRSAHEAWVANGRDAGSLLAGIELDSAIEFMSWPVAAGQLDEHVKAFVDQSRLAVIAQRQRRRRFTQAAGATALAALVFAGAAVYFLQLARRSSDEAVSRQLALQSATLGAEDPSLSTQLAVAAYHRAPTVEARSALIIAASHMPSARYLGEPGPTGLAVTPGGSRFAYSDGVNARIVVMDRTPTGYEEAATHELADPDHQVYGMAISPDGRLIAFGGTDFYANVWDTETGDAAQLDDTLTYYQGAVQSVLFSSDGTRIYASGTSEGGIGTWDVGYGVEQTTQPLIPAPGSIMTLATDREQRLMATGNNDGEVQLWSLSEATEPLWTYRADTSPSALSSAISPDGRWLAMGFRTGTVEIWDISDPSAPVAVDFDGDLFGSWTTSLDFSPNGERFVAASSDGQAIFWEVDGWQRMGDGVTHPNGVTNARFVDNKSLLVALADGSVRTWSLEHPALLSFGAPVWATEFDEAGETLLAVSRERSVLWTVDSDGLGSAVELLNPEDDLIFSGAGDLSPDGRTVAAGTREGTVLLLALNEDRSRWDTQHRLDGMGSLVETVTFSDDGSMLAAVAREGLMKIWRIGDGDPKEVAEVVQEGVAFDVAIDPSGTTLVSTTANGVALMYSLEAGVAEPIGEISVGDDSASGVTFHPTERLLVTGNHDGTVSIWDYSVAEPTLVERVSGPNGRIHSVAVSSDATLMAGSASDGSVWVWDISTPAEPTLAARLSSEGQMYSIAFAPSGDLLVGAGAGEVLTAWNLDADALAADMCRDIGTGVTESEWGRLVPGADFSPPCG